MCETSKGSITVRERKESRGKETRVLTQGKRDKRFLIRWAGKEGQRRGVGGKGSVECVYVDSYIL